MGQMWACLCLQSNQLFIAPALSIEHTGENTFFLKKKEKYYKLLAAILLESLFQHKHCRLFTFIDTYQTYDTQQDKKNDINKEYKRYSCKKSCKSCIYTVNNALNSAYICPFLLLLLVKVFS